MFLIKDHGNCDSSSCELAGGVLALEMAELASQSVSCNLVIHPVLQEDILC